MVYLTRPVHNSRTNSRRIIKIGSKVAHDMSNIASMLLHPGGGIPWWPNPAATPLVIKQQFFLHLLWDSDAVFITHNLDIGYNVDQLDLHAYIGKKQRLVLLIHAHIAVTTVLSNVLSNHFLQNKLTITFNKMITSGKYDWSYPSCWLPKLSAC